MTLDGVDVMGDRLAEEVRSRLHILSAYHLTKLIPESLSITFVPKSDDCL